MLSTPVNLKRKGDMTCRFILEPADKGLSRVFREGFKTRRAARVGKEFGMVAREESDVLVSGLRAM